MNISGDQRKLPWAGVARSAAARIERIIRGRRKTPAFMAEI